VLGCGPVTDNAPSSSRALAPHLLHAGAFTHQIPEWWSDEEIFRWGRARVKANGQLDLDESTKMLRAHLEWRRGMMLDDEDYNWGDTHAEAQERSGRGEFSFMLSPQYACRAAMPRCDQSAQQFSAMYPCSFCGIGKDGQPVYYERIGAVDWKVLREIRGRDGAQWDEVFCRYTYCFLEFEFQ